MTAPYSDWFHFDIGDGVVFGNEPPETLHYDPAEKLTIIRRLARYLVEDRVSNGGVGIHCNIHCNTHCNKGIGRAGCVIGCCVVASPVSAADAIGRIKALWSDKRRRQQIKHDLWEPVANRIRALEASALERRAQGGED